MAERAVVDQGVGEPEYILGDRAPFGTVAVEQGVRGTVGRDQCELPAQVVRVHHPGVQALPARRAVNVHGVTGQQHAASAIGTG